MLDLDIVVGSQRRDAGRSLEAATADIVQASYQWLEFYRAHVFLVSSWDIFPADRRRTDYPATSVQSTREYSIGEDDQCVSSRWGNMQSPDAKRDKQRVTPL
jgi:hypothetical protein